MKNAMQPQHSLHYAYYFSNIHIQNLVAILSQLDLQMSKKNTKRGLGVVQLVEWLPGVHGLGWVEP